MYHDILLLFYLRISFKKNTYFYDIYSKYITPCVVMTYAMSDAI
jgi:hypothetical protein